MFFPLCPYWNLVGQPQMSSPHELNRWAIFKLGTNDGKEWQSKPRGQTSVAMRQMRIRKAIIRWGTENLSVNYDYWSSR